MQRSIRPVKRLGQNFLTDPNVARKVVAALRAPTDARVVEIGAGTGALTTLLAERYSDLIAIEIDERAVALLRGLVEDVDIRHEDVLQVNWASLCRDDQPLYVVGNLPYYITSQILFGLLEHRAHVHEGVFMMQLEVAERLDATPRTKAYGILSVILQHYAEVEVLFRVSRNVFYPKPDVTSAVVRFGFRDPAVGDVDFNLFRLVVRTAFNQRRKTLKNSLERLLDERGWVLPDHLSSRRAEELTPDEFVTLTRIMSETLHGPDDHQ